MMLNFMKHDFVIDKIELACLVESGKGSLIHRNRYSHGLAIFLDGERNFCFDDKKMNVTKNTIVYFPKGSNYTIKEKEQSDCYAINFQMSSDCSFPPFAFKIKNRDLFLKYFKDSQRNWITKNNGYNAKIKSDLYSIIYNMQFEFNLPYGKISVIQPAIDYIHSNYCEKPISVSYLASLCNISTVYLSSCFVKSFGLSPIKYINHLKMKRAKELLSSKMYTVTDVCFLSGYNNESYFSREFKKCFDVSPIEFKRSCM